MKIRIKAISNSSAGEKVMDEIKSALTKAGYKLTRYGKRTDIIEYDVTYRGKMAGKVNFGTDSDVFQMYPIGGPRAKAMWFVTDATSQQEIKKKIGEFLTQLKDYVSV